MAFGSALDPIISPARLPTVAYIFVHDLPQVTHPACALTELYLSRLRVERLDYPLGAINLVLMEL